MGYTTLCLAASALLSLAGCGVDAKGTGYRSSRGGAYSRSGAYGYGSMWLWHGGYRGHRSSSSSGIDAATLNSTATQLYCKRQVHLDKGYAADTVGSRIALNSTRYCEKRVTPVDGAVENTPITDIFLDVYEFKFEAGQGKAPSVLMQQYDDIDSTYVAAASPVQVVLTKLIEYTSDTTTIAKVINTRDLTWKAYRTAPNKTVFGYPSSYFKDQSRIVTLAIRGTNPPANTIDLTVAFSISEDYAEDTFGDHLFMRPSGVEMHVTLRKYDQFETPIAGATPKYVKCKEHAWEGEAPASHTHTPPQHARPRARPGHRRQPLDVPHDACSGDEVRHGVRPARPQPHRGGTAAGHGRTWQALLLLGRQHEQDGLLPGPDGAGTRLCPPHVARHRRVRRGHPVHDGLRGAGCPRGQAGDAAAVPREQGYRNVCTRKPPPPPPLPSHPITFPHPSFHRSFAAYDPLQVNNQYSRPKQGDLISWSTTLGTWDYAETTAPRTGAASALTASLGLSMASVLALLLALL